MAEPDALEGAGEAPADGSATPVDLTPVDWAAVRQAYEGTGLPLAELQRRFGLTRGQLRWRQQHEGWPKRPAAQGEGAVTRLMAASPRRLRSRLLCLMHLSLAEIESKAARGGRVDPEAAGTLQALGGAWAHLKSGTERGGTMKGQRRAGRLNGTGPDADGSGEPGAHNNKKNTDEPGYRAGGAEPAGGNRIDQLRAEVRSRLARLREPQK